MIHLFWFTHPRDNKYEAYQFSNQEIQKNFLLEFSKYDEVAWHHCNDRGRVTLNRDDILIGHPPWPSDQQHPYQNWMFDNGLDGPGSVHPNAFVVFPWAAASKSHGSIDRSFEMLTSCRGFFGMGGVIHYDENVANAPEDTLWRRSQSKLIRINMGCDARFLPFGAAPRHTNGLLHISSLYPYKRPEFMLASLPPDKCRLYIGTENGYIVDRMAAEGKIPHNVSALGPVKNADPAMNQFIIENCSYYLHCSREPQATTILENALRGLVPILTPHAGFSCPDAIYLTEDDPVENQRIIREALAMPDEECRDRSLGVRQHVLQYHSWQRICQNMYIAIRALMSGQDVSRRGEDYS